ncbi:MAG: hypothetical protein ACR2PX_10070 [Endozoicomonas sp.]|uniref:hypothetical protein n=1 Tax=Endozoicomonas sp. TaxID=1892382 RepID=UPI003D9B0587
MKLNAWVFSFLMLFSGHSALAGEYYVEDALSGGILSHQRLIKALMGQQHIIVTWDRSSKRCVPADSAVLNEITKMMLNHHWLQTLVLGWVESHSDQAQLLRKHSLETPLDSFINRYSSFYHPLFQPDNTLLSQLHAEGVKLAPGDFSFKPFVEGMNEMSEMGYLMATAPIKDELFQSDFKVHEKAIVRLNQIKNTLGEKAFNNLVLQFPGSHTVSSEILTRRFNSQVEQDEGLAWFSQASGQLVLMPYYTHARKDVGFVPYLRKLQPFAQIKVVLIVTKECREASEGYSGVDYLLVEH